MKYHDNRQMSRMSVNISLLIKNMTAETIYGKKGSSRVDVGASILAETFSVYRESFSDLYISMKRCLE